MEKNKYLKQYKHKNDSYQNISNRYPLLIHSLLNELLKIDGYSEVEIGFGTGTNIDVIRKITNNNINKIPKHVFFKILDLYVKVFCK